MQRDHGWIHTLLEEAENERMHLLTFLRVRNPGIMFRSCVLVAQGCVTRHHSFARSLQPHSLTHGLVGCCLQPGVQCLLPVLLDRTASLPSVRGLPGRGGCQDLHKVGSTAATHHCRVGFLLELTIRCSVQVHRGSGRWQAANLGDDACIRHCQGLLAPGG